MEGGIRGLIVVISGFIIQALVFGTSATLGVFNVSFVEYFDGDVVGVSLLNAIYYALFYATGPLVSTLMSWMSYRKVCILGVAMVVTGTFCSPLLPSLTFLYFFFGVLTGLGSCLVYIPCHTLCGLYYDRHRTLTTGIATAGGGVGAMALPVVMEKLIEEYTWRGSMTILSGMLLNLLVFAMFMIPPPETPESEEEKDKEEQQHGEQLLTPTSDGSSRRFREFSFIVEPPKTTEEGPNSKSDQSLHSDNHEPDLDIEELDSFPLSQSAPNPASHGILSSSPSQNGSELKPLRRNSQSRPPVVRLVSRLSVSIQDVEDIPEARERRAKRPSFVSVNDITPFKSLPEKRGFKDNLKEHIKSHTVIFKNYQFILYFLCTLIFSLTSTVCYTFGPELLVERGNTYSTAALMYMFVGAGMLCGGLLVSLVCNFLGQATGCLILGCMLLGTGLCVVPITAGYIELIVVHFILGLSMGVLNSLCLVLVVEILGVEHMGVGLGHILMSIGIGAFVGPPVFGAMREAQNSYNSVFFVNGVMTLAAGVLMVPVLVTNTARAKCSKGNDET